ncbi:MAG TPA: hypothetical protein VF631_10960 [Allosphingosinicella sp.]|jgi:hypothetical protein|uniref:hypothetical protein n=1 Tax=Allosphingosinicella sp. TaxID=2823234 RepID=UPI002F28CCBE
MRKAILISLSLAIPFAPATAADIFLRISPGSEQASRFEDGWRIIDSVGAKSIIRFVAPGPALNKRGEFMLVALNPGALPFDIGPKNVTAALDDGTAVKIVGYDVLMKEESRRQSRQNSGMALATPSADNGATSGTETYSALGSIRSAPYNSMASGAINHTKTTKGNYTKTDKGRAVVEEAIANEQYRAGTAGVLERQADSVRAIESQVLQTTTVGPRKVVSGMLFFDLPKKLRRAKEPVPVTFTVQVGEDKHQFRGSFDPS